jgi:WD40 repeat protein
MAVSPDGRRLFSSNWRGREVRLWDVEGRKQLDRGECGGSEPIRVSFTPDGRQVLCGDMDGVIRIFDLRSGKPGLAETP